METFGDIVQTLAVFGGISAVIWTSAKAKLEHRKLDMLAGRGQASNQAQQAAPDGSAQGSQFPLVSGGRRDDTVLAELRSLKQQIGEMQSTSHQFDLAFDAALERMEQRVAHLEAKSMGAQAAPQTVSQTTPQEAPTVLRNGHQ